LVVEEEAVVEQPDPVQGVPAQHHRSAGHPGYPERPLGVDDRWFDAERPGEPGRPQSGAEVRQQGREAEGRVLASSVFVLQRRAHRTGARMGREACGEREQCAWARPGVRIEKTEELRYAAVVAQVKEPLIVGVAEAAV